MQAWVADWLPLIAVAGLAGLFNLIVAAEKFNRKFRSPFFTPRTSLGLWWWILVQLSLPTACFWLPFSHCREGRSRYITRVYDSSL